MSLGKYAFEAQVRADELLDLVSEEEALDIWEWLKSLEAEKWTVMSSGGPPARTKTVLQMSAKKRLDWQTKRRLQGDFWECWVEARHWALRSANALTIAADLEDAIGLPYGKACLRAAQVAGRHLDQVPREFCVFFQYRELRTNRGYTP